MGDANALDPTITPFNFCIPAIFGVMGHFVFLVLPEPQTLWVDADGDDAELRLDVVDAGG